MKTVKDKVVAITGAGSGLGAALARSYAARGAHVALADVNQEGLQETAASISPDTKVTTHLVDVSDRERVYRWADEVIEQHGTIDVVVNNAGVISFNSLEASSYDDIQWVMDINFYGVVYVTKAFLPHLKQRPEANIVNVSSLNGLLSFPGNGAYNASKHAVKAFSQTLTLELRGSPVTLTTVHPGGMKTHIVKNSRFEKSISGGSDKGALIDTASKVGLTPHKAAEIIVKGMLKSKTRLLVGIDAHLLELFNRLMPVTFPKWLGVLMSKYG